MNKIRPTCMLVMMFTENVETLSIVLEGYKNNDLVNC